MSLSPHLILLYFFLWVSLVFLGSCSPAPKLASQVQEPALDGAFSSGSTQTAYLESTSGTPSLEKPPTSGLSTDASPEVESAVREQPVPGALETATTTALPTPVPLTCWKEGGKMVMSTLRSEKLKLPMEYRVWLPPCYDEQGTRRYPVLYMIHGQNYNEDQWDRLGMDETAETLISNGELPPFLIVMPRDRNWSQPADDPFGEVLVNELVPLIDATYRTIPERQYRAIGGLSRGAGWAVHLGLSHWELFGAIGAHSLPVFWTDTPKINRWLDEMPPDQQPRIYLDIGDRDRPQILESARWFEELLTRKGYAHVWHLFPGYHEEKYWESHVEQYLRWYAQPWFEPLAANLGYNPPHDTDNRTS